MVLPAEALAAGPLKAEVFAVDASPPIGSPRAYDPAKGVVHPRLRRPAGPRVMEASIRSLVDRGDPAIRQ